MTDVVDLDTEDCKRGCLAVLTTVYLKIRMLQYYDCITAVILTVFVGLSQSLHV